MIACASETVFVRKSTQLPLPLSRESSRLSLTTSSVSRWCSDVVHSFRSFLPVLARPRRAHARLSSNANPCFCGLAASPVPVYQPSFPVLAAPSRLDNVCAEPKPTDSRYLDILHKEYTRHQDFPRTQPKDMVRRPSPAPPPLCFAVLLVARPPAMLAHAEAQGAEPKRFFCKRSTRDLSPLSSSLSWSDRRGVFLVLCLPYCSHVCIPPTPK